MNYFVRSSRGHSL